jgi:sorting nexin-29
VTLRERLSNVLKNQGKKRKRRNIYKLKNEEDINLYQQKINEKLEVTEGIQDVQIEWNNIKSVTVEAAKEALGEKKGKRYKEWSDEECRTAIQEKNNMRKIMLQRMTRSSKETYLEYRRRANKIRLEKKREMLKRQIESREADKERADTRKYYQTVNRFRKGFQPRLNTCKDNSGKLIEGDDNILEHWAGYFRTQFEKENSEQESDEEVSVTAEPLVTERSQEETEKAICNLKINKAPGEDDIAVELIKNASRELNKRLHLLIRKIWRDEKMPDDWKVGLIVPLIKKGDKMKCENCRGIRLLNITYKILSNIILELLKEYSEEILEEYQCGFRPRRGTTDQIFTVRQILEKFYAHDIDLHILFTDFKKTFDCINQKKLLESLVSFGIPKKIERLVKMTLEGAQAKVIVDGKISTPFGISIEVRQGDGFSATLFSLVLHKALKNLEQSNAILNRLTQICGYADDILVIARSFPNLEALCDELSREAGRVGLVVNPDKTKHMRFSAFPS